MAVGELGRVAHALGGHGLDAGVVRRRGGLVGQHDREAQLGEERVPERVVLVHVERARDAHGAAGRLLRGEHRAVKEQLVLEVKEVGGVVLARARAAGALLAAVARDEATAAAKVVDREQAVVGAAPAVDVGVLDLEVVNLLAGEQLRGAADSGAVAGEKGRAVGAHRAGDVRSDDVAPGEQLEGAQGGVGHEGAALDHAVLADLVEVAQLDDLEQGVLDDGVGEARRHVADGRALLLRLLDAGVHEDGAAAAQVDRVLGADGLLRELHDVHVHRHREALDEAAATRRAGLVQHDVLDDAIAHAQALHVLAADVQDELDAGEERAGAAQVGHGLDLTGVGLERLDEQRLAVAGRGHVPDGAASRDMRVEVGHDGLGRAEDVAVVVAVPRVQQLAVLAHHGGLHRGGAGVDADEHAGARIGREVALGHDLAVVALLERAVRLLVGEQRVEARDLGALRVAERVDGLDELGERCELVGLVRHGGAARHEQVRVLGHDAVLLIELERDVEPLTQLGEVLQRAAEERDVAANGAAAREARDGLRDDGLEDGGGDIGGCRALVQQGLDVGLGEHAAAGGDRVDGRRLAGELVQAGRVGVQQRGHLVDERARAAGAGAVHALLDALVEVDDLGVLAAELDGDIGRGDQGLHGALARDDLLHELQAEPLAEQKTARAGDGAGHGRALEQAGRAHEQVARAGAHVGVVALVLGVHDLVVVVEHGELDRGGAHVDAQVQGAVVVLRVVDGRLSHRILPCCWRCSVP